MLLIGESGYTSDYRVQGHTPQKDFNSVLITGQKAEEELYSGDRVSFSGSIGYFSSRRGRSLDVHGRYIKQDN